MKEKLIKLIKELEANPEKTCLNPNSATCEGCQYLVNRFLCNMTERKADYLLENGVIVTPCKVGDTVYTNCAMTGWYFRKKDKPYSAKVVFVGLNDSEKMGGGLINVVYGKHDFMMQFSFSDIGKTVFLTREEAEKALKERC